MAKAIARLNVGPISSGADNETLGLALWPGLGLLPIKRGGFGLSLE